ncbi:O-methyltransferase [Purpureocillium lilacinum]|uniref:O-methyltransferase n=1 Tax=Purpureocillium lilacinum TaxID=33203 RepID=A0A179HXS7_PURLI|nr:O-methyltransferase [Purpureocillium lilacinum]OAQ94133.1 O-methyltransferase [Purpureocillium lilacinum]
MAKFRVPSWLQSPSSAAEADRKKQNRRSFAGFSSLKARPEATVAPEPNTVQREKPVPEEAAPNGQFRMVELAKKIAAESEKVETYFKNNSLPEPAFGADAPEDYPDLPGDVQRSRQEIVNSCQELERLARGPRECVRWGAWAFLDTLSLQVVNRYDIAKLVPLDAPIPLSELQTKTTLDPINLARVLRHAMTNRIFCEPSPGLIAHTAASRLLATDASLQDWVGFNAEDHFPAAAHVLDALQEHPEATSLTQTGFNYAYGTVDKEPMFVTLGKDPVRAKRFGGAMMSLTGTAGYEVRYFVDGCDLTAVNEQKGTFVDIGGSHGFVCVELAKRWNAMKFVVQDLPKTVESAPKPICEDESVAERIDFQVHDFFKEQPIKDADVYYFRWIVHNYSNPYAVKLLRNLVPALKPGARIIINEHCLEQPGIDDPWDDKLMRSMDMVMLALLNAQERREDEFKALFAEADSRFAFKGAKRIEGCRMSIVEAVWEPEVPKTVGTEQNGDVEVPDADGE